MICRLYLLENSHLPNSDYSVINYENKYVSTSILLGSATLAKQVVEM